MATAAGQHSALGQSSELWSSDAQQVAKGKKKGFWRMRFGTIIAVTKE